AAPTTALMPTSPICHLRSAVGENGNKEEESEAWGREIDTSTATVEPQRHCHPLPQPNLLINGSVLFDFHRSR
ncbi:hypothetical protein U1Q18_025217, partial [Sarracenia purpurea var. burkii]